MSSLFWGKMVDQNMNGSVAWMKLCHNQPVLCLYLGSHHRTSHVSPEEMRKQVVLVLTHTPQFPAGFYDPGQLSPWFLCDLTWIVGVCDSSSGVKEMSWLLWPPFCPVYFTFGAISDFECAPSLQVSNTSALNLCFSTSTLQGSVFYPGAAGGWQCGPKALSKSSLGVWRVRVRSPPAAGNNTPHWTCQIHHYCVSLDLIRPVLFRIKKA